MAKIGKQTVTLVDSEGDPLRVTDDGRLDVNTFDQTATTLTTYEQFEAAITATIITDDANGIDTARQQDCKEIIIQADSDNSGYIMIGGSNVAADTHGIRINAGDTLILAVIDTNTVYIDGSAISQKVNVSIVK